MSVNIDLITANGNGQGDLAKQILANGKIDTGQMRPWFNPKDGRSYISVFSGGDPKDIKNYKNMPITTNATLRRDEWKALDQAVLRVAESRLGGVQDLKNRGLVYNLGNGMGSTVLEYHDVAGDLTASTTMDGVTRGQNNTPNYTTNYIPLPIIHVDYTINERVLAASRSMGNPIDTTLAERASRAVNSTLEGMLFTNTTYGYGGGTIYSYLNHPDRNQKTIVSWTASAKTATDIVNDVMDMKQKSIDAHHYGPWVLYIPTGYEVLMDEDYDVSGSSLQTIRQRLLAIDGIEEVKVIDKLPADTVLLVEMTTDVVRWVNGMNIQNVEWSSEGGMVHNFKVMTIQVPQVRADQNGNSGVIHASV